MNKRKPLKTSIIMAGCLLTISAAPVSGFDLGDVFSNAIDRSVNRVVNNTVNNAVHRIEDAITEGIPELDNDAKTDDGEEISISQGVVIFGYDSCPHCRNAYKFLKQYNVDYQLMDIRRDAKASRIARNKGVSGVPTMYVEGEKIVGFSASSYRKLLEKHGKL